MSVVVAEVVGGGVCTGGPRDLATQCIEFIRGERIAGGTGGNSSRRANYNGCRRKGFGDVIPSVVLEESGAVVDEIARGVAFARSI